MRLYKFSKVLETGLIYIYSGKYTTSSFANSQAQ